jgi:hypothetical protein
VSETLNFLTPLPDIDQHIDMHSPLERGLGSERCRGDLDACRGSLPPLSGLLHLERIQRIEEILKEYFRRE